MKRFHDVMAKCPYYGGEEKQKIFDTFADKSEANEKTLEIEEAALGNIIKDEAKRIKEKQGK